MITSRRSFLVCALALVFANANAPKARAHRLARTETDVRIADDRSVTVTHVYHMQDAQDALYQAARIDTPDLTSLKARATLALYTEETFSLLVDSKSVPLTLIGAEIIGDNVYVYQEGIVPEGSLSVDARMLRDLIRGQSNSVNIVRNDQTITLDFTRDDGVKAVA